VVYDANSVSVRHAGVYTGGCARDAAADAKVAAYNAEPDWAQTDSRILFRHPRALDSVANMRPLDSSVNRSLRPGFRLVSGSKQLARAVPFGAIWPA